MTNAEQLRKASLQTTIAAQQAIVPVDNKHRGDIADIVRKANDEHRHLSGLTPIAPFIAAEEEAAPAEPPPLTATQSEQLAALSKDLEIDESMGTVHPSNLSDDEMFAEHDAQEEGEDESEFEFEIEDSEEAVAEDDPEPEAEEEPGKEKPKPKPKPKAKPAKKKKKR